MRVYDLEQIVVENIHNWVFNSNQFDSYMTRNKLYHKFDMKYFNKHKQGYISYSEDKNTKYWAEYIPTFKRYLSFYNHIKEDK